MRGNTGIFTWALVAVQCLCGAYFLWEIVASIAGLPSLPLRWQTRELVELGASLGLILGALLTVRLLFVAQRARQRADQARRMTSGQFTEIVDGYFQRLAFTEAETDVAWMLLKGLSTAEIAELRDTKLGTVKAQCTALYRKAGVKSKGQLFSLIVEDLLL
ncbi:helix-turn-helix transcriptional regulator [Cognatishimia activa]|uniref:Helix-turn-helix transcriptional regulator n=1 Tax=Cognatishimia activa TaxID=1715691 RepID=A0A975ENM2_9RHOB|nr:LuxR C-terminal-related transcriptional regulator [Cognatishimia activa]QTN35385.1 helix-turn-helix transcriptional regulator [Cognatishimia activa]